MSTKFYEMFNTALENFMNDLIKTFPADNDFKLFKGTIKLLKLAIKVSPKLAWALSKKLYFNGKISFYNLDKIQNFMSTVVDYYNEQYPNYLKGIKILNKNLPIEFQRPWINYQKKGE